MAFGPQFVKEFIKMGANLEIRDEYELRAVLEWIELAKQQGTRLTIDVSDYGPEYVRKMIQAAKGSEKIVFKL